MPLIDVLKKQLSLYPFVDFALLFGSYARGTATQMSDIDIAISTRVDIDLFAMGEIIADLETAVNKKIDLVLLNTLYKNNPKLAFNITSNHVPILIQDEAGYVDFKAQSLLYFFDIEPMVTMFDRALLQRIDDGTFAKTATS